MTSTDDYRCATCGTYWPVRILAADCCTPERRARLAAHDGQVILLGMTSDDYPVWVCPYCKSTLTTPLTSNSTHGSAFNTAIPGDQHEGDCPKGCRRKVGDGTWQMDRNNYNAQGIEPEL